MRNSSKRLKLNENSGFYGLFNDMPKRDKVCIQGAEIVPTNVNQCKVSYDGKSVYSNARFRIGDIVEICPTRPISKSSLYSREVRDLVFEVERDTTFVIPLGYCQYYDIIDRFHPEANCDYEWNPEKKVIVIRAIKPIEKRTVLVLNIEK